MQKWEYATLERQQTLKEITFQMGGKSPEKAGELYDVSPVLAKLGNDGWELAVALPGPAQRPDDWIMIFKRPKV